MVTTKELQEEIRSLRQEQIALKKRLCKLESVNLSTRTEQKVLQTKIPAQPQNNPPVQAQSESSSSNTGAIICIVFGALFILTIYGAVIGIPLIIIGIVLLNKNKQNSQDNQPIEEDQTPQPTSSLEEQQVQTTKPHTHVQHTEAGYNPMHWLGVIGMAALTIGVAYFVMFTVENNWFGESLSIFLSLFLSIILIISGLLIKGSLKNWGNILTGGGFALAYFTTYATYHYVEYREAFNLSQIFTLLLLSVVVACALYVSMRKNNRIIASLSLLLAYLTAFLSTQEYVLTLPYIAIISLAYVFVSTRRQWLELDIGSHVFTYLIFLLWALQHSTEFLIGAVFLALFSFGFTMTHIRKREQTISRVLAIGNALAFFFSFIYLLLTNNYDLWLWAVIMAAAYAIAELACSHKDKKESSLSVIFEWTSLIYLTIAIFDFFTKIHITIALVILAMLLILLKRRRSAIITAVLAYTHILIWDVLVREDDRILASLLGAVLFFVLRFTKTLSWEQPQIYSWAAVFLISLLIGLQATGIQITVLWFALIILLVWLARTYKLPEFRQQALALSTIFLFHVILAEVLGGGEHRVIAASLAAILFYILRASTPKDSKEVKEAYSWVSAAVIALTLAVEAKNYWITIFWALLGLLLLASGFVWKNKSFRLQGLSLFALVVLKALLIDTSQLEPQWRTLSFIIVGVLLLLGSFMYAKYKDRLK